MHRRDANFNVLGILTLPCLFDGYGAAILKNRFADNGSYGHQTNGDIAVVNFEDGHPTSCYRGNVDTAGLTTSPVGLQQTHPVCTGAGAQANVNVPLVEEILCGNEGSLVGRASRAQVAALPEPHARGHAPATKNLATMADPVRARARQSVVSQLARSSAAAARYRLARPWPLGLDKRATPRAWSPTRTPRRAVRERRAVVCSRTSPRRQDSPPSRRSRPAGRSSSPMMRRRPER